MDGTGNELFTGTAFTGYQHIGASFGNLADHFINMEHGGAVAHNFTEM